MRFFILLTTVCLFQQFLFAQSDACTTFRAATGFYDGESLWWREDEADQVLTGQCTFQFNEATRTFTFTSAVPMCYLGFELVSVPHPDVCPATPCNWQWQSGPNQSSVLTVQFPATIAPCLPASGQMNELYHFRFRVYYKKPLFEAKNPKT